MQICCEQSHCSTYAKPFSKSNLFAWRLALLVIQELVWTRALHGPTLCGPAWDCQLLVLPDPDLPRWNAYLFKRGPGPVKRPRRTSSRSCPWKVLVHLVRLAIICMKDTVKTLCVGTKMWMPTGDFTSICSKDKTFRDIIEHIHVADSTQSNMNWSCNGLKMFSIYVCVGLHFGFSVPFKSRRSLR